MKLLKLLNAPFWLKTIFSVIAGTCFFTDAFALKYVSLYTAGCERITGILVNAENRQADVLTLDGNVVQFNTFDVQFAVEYTYEILLNNTISNGEKLNYYEIFTREDGLEVPLAKGWLSGGDDETFALVNNEGREKLVNIGDITRISPLSPPDKWQLDKARQPLKFTHSYQFSACPYPEDQVNARPVYPNKLMSDRFEIKRYFDQFQIIQERIEFLMSEQKFYAKPFYFKSENKLGMWYNLQSRHVSHSKRLNKLLPTYINNYSALPFDYQHVIVGGPMTLDFTPYTAAQNQFFYHMRSGYFGLYILYDLDVLLLGNDYDPIRSDFNVGNDDTLTEMGSLNVYFGYDVFKASIGNAFSKFYIKIKNRLFAVDPSEANIRYGLHYENFDYKSDLFFSPLLFQYKANPSTLYERSQTQSTEELQAYLSNLPEYVYRGYYARFNFTKLYDTDSLGFSLVYRNILFKYSQNLLSQNKIDPDNPPAVYQSTSWILGIHYTHRFNSALSMNFHTSGEFLENDNGYSRIGYTMTNGSEVKTDDKESHQFYDVGAALFLNF